ncbi:MAG: hypothetical protein HYT13_01125, partial [Candidatus Liptonbacteria bacterium]|nr:hypothetical protein [Candidatus Liptonbacteria bacterium]
MPKSFDVRIVDVDKAEEGKNLRRVTNEEIVTILEGNRAVVRNWFDLPMFPEWWKGDPIAAPHRERHEAKFLEKYGRMPNIDDSRDRTVLLEEFVFGDTETSNEWIEDHTGISSRLFAKPDVATSDLASEAADNVLAAAGVEACEVRGIFVATVTPDHPQTPPMAAIVSAKLGINGKGKRYLPDMPFIDGTAACSSFVVVLRAACAIAQSEGGLYLVIGADVMSRTVNPFSRNMFPILGDGAGAVLLEAY